MIEDIGEFSMYFRLSMRRIANSNEVIPNCIVDFDADGEVVGIELLHSGTAASEQSAIAQYRFC